MKGLSSLSAILSIDIDYIKKNFTKSLSSLGVDSISITRLKSLLDEDISYQKIYSYSLEKILSLITIKDSNVAQDKVPTIGTSELSFPLTPMQFSYFLGRENDCPCQVYSEFDIRNLDLDIFIIACKKVVEKHEMLRACLCEDVEQKINYASNISSLIDETLYPHSFSEKIREESKRFFIENRNKYWSIKFSSLNENCIRVHLLLDMLFVDANSFFILADEISKIYNEVKEGEVESLPNSFGAFREYCNYISLRNPKEKSIQYWNEKLNRTALAPELPISSNKKPLPQYSRFSKIIEESVWRSIREYAKYINASPNSILLTLFSEVVRLYSKNKDFSITVTLSDRENYGSKYANVVGDFTNVFISSFFETDGDIKDKILSTNAQIICAIDHSDINGLEYIKNLREYFGDNSIAFPVVFTSFIGIVKSDIEFNDCSIRLNYQQTQTPQIYLDNQVYELNGQLHINWDFDSNVIRPEIISGMLDCFEYSLSNFHNETFVVSISPREKETVHRLNDTTIDLGHDADSLLHELFTRNVNAYRDKVAIVDVDENVTYGELYEYCKNIADEILQRSSIGSEPVVIGFDKSWKQIASVLATSMAGKYYVPLSTSSPIARNIEIIDECNAGLLIFQTESEKERFLGLEFKCNPIFLDHIDAKPLKDFSPQNTDNSETAYVIFTSGSTGKPKGVSISHKSVVNTCLDFNKRFSIKDSVITFAVSALNFDLSVWDIFGTFYSGGMLVLCKEGGAQDPTYMWELISRHGVNVINVVPCIFEMLIDTYRKDLQIKLEKVFLSGDAIAKFLVKRANEIFPTIEIVALGGATEASIWSNYHICNDETYSVGDINVQYGRALGNQQIYVLDSNLEYRPFGVEGDIYIGGIGLAQGYLNDKILTDEKFISTNKFGRLYSTGDIGKYLKNGEIEFIGRKDDQTKINGYRIELREIESCISKLLYVERAIATVVDDGKFLVCFIKAIQGCEITDLEEKIIEHCNRFLQSYSIPSKLIFIEQIPLSINGKVDYKKLKSLVYFANKAEKASSNQNVFVSKLLDSLSEVLNLSSKNISLDKSLFQQGLNSLSSIKLINSLSQKLSIEIPYTSIFNYPTVVKFADYISTVADNSIKEISSKELLPFEGKKYYDNEKDDIAVVSIACRFPGDSNNASEFWQMLLQSKNCMTEIPHDRFDINAYYNIKSIEKGYNSSQGAFIKNIDNFDYRFFDITEAEAYHIDPQQRLLLEVAYESLYNLGYNRGDLLDKNIGVVIGQMNYDWLADLDCGLEYASTGVAPSITANRISYVLGLSGPSMTVDTACSSSLVAIDIASKFINNGDCDTVIVGGVNLILSPKPFFFTSQAGMLSTNSRCATFDENADGIARGEGVGVVVLKKLSAAITDGNDILAIVKASCVNQDGKSASLTAPNQSAQSALIRHTLEKANLQPSDIDYIECHGTGTPLGDPIEIAALKETFGTERNSPLVLGSLKTNIGHLEGAAGIAGFIKAVQVARNRIAPGNVHFKNLNPKIDLKNFYATISASPIHLNPDMDKSLYAGVSSFGYGGTNAHVVVKSWSSEHEVKQNKPPYKSIKVGWNIQDMMKSKAPHRYLFENCENGSLRSKNIESSPTKQGYFLSRKEIREAVTSSLLQFINRDNFDAARPFMEMGLSSLDLVQFRQKIFEKLPKLKDFSIDFIFNYPTVESLVGYLCESLDIQDIQNNDSSIWTKLNQIEGEKPIFFIGGVVGNIEKTFSTLARAIENPVYGTMPIIPEDFEETKITLDSLAKDLYESLIAEFSEEESFIVGGLSFGATLAFELACILERNKKLEKLVLLDPRHMSPFIAPKDFAPFEKLLEKYNPRTQLKSKTLIFQCEVPLLDSQTDLMKEASRSFLTSIEINYRFKNVCLDLEIIQTPGHHFNFLYKHYESIAARLNHDDRKTIHRNNTNHRIAVIAASLKIPGKVSTPDELWEMLLAKRDCVSDIPGNRFDLFPYFDISGEKYGTTYTKKGGFIEGIEYFDNEFFGISLLEAKLMDPQQRCLLEVVYEALYNAGYNKTSLNNTDTSVYIGLANDDWASMHRDPEAGSPYFGAGSSDSIVSNRISYIFGLKGASMTVDTACSSSLVALDLAVKALQRGETSLSIVGGVNAILDARMYISACATKALSKKGRCASFDAGSDGYCRGEGVGVVILKRLQDAIDNDDNILAVVEGSAINQDGRTVSLTSPNGLAQEQVIKKALEEANLQGQDIDYVECHGTGTPLGDPIEIHALKRVFSKDREKKLVVGSIKSNIGHLEGAAGIIGFIKTIEVLKRKAASGITHFTNLNPQIDISDFNVVFPEELTPLNLTSKELYAGVSSFGFGGTNAHVILSSSTQAKSYAYKQVSYNKKFIPWNATDNISNIAAHRFTKNANRESIGNNISKEAYQNNIASGLSFERTFCSLDHHENINHPIAIISTACRLPGGINSIDDMWQMLIARKDCTSSIPQSRFDIDNFLVKNRLNKIYTDRGAFIDDVENFDYKLFNISLAEAKLMDPHQRHLLEVTYQAIISAGYTVEDLKNSSTGVFVGVSNQDWAISATDDNAENPFFGTGVSNSLLANRISYAFGFSGPSISMDTACSSSLVALDLAVQNLKNGECDLAIVAGANIIMHYRTYLGSCAANMLSIQGRCAAFDGSADGYCRGEGVGVVILKRLIEAQHDGDSVLSVIRSTAVNHDGSKQLITTPNKEAQEKVIKRALQIANLESNSIDYLECHGTGTPVGDPIEMLAVQNIFSSFRKNPLVIGSIKSNIGHTEGAAGILGIIKTVEVLRRRISPGIVHFQKLNQNILDSNDFLITNENIQLTNSNNTILAGVSSYGFGGVNAHAILESYGHFEPKKSIPVNFDHSFLPWKKLLHLHLSNYSAKNNEMFLTSRRIKLFEDHRINNFIYMPAANYAIMLAAASSVEEGIDRNFVARMHNFSLLKPLIVELDSSIKIDLEKQSATISDANNNVFCKASRVQVLPNYLQKENLDFNKFFHQTTKALDLEKEYKWLNANGIDFGPRYRSVKKMQIIKNEALAEISVSMDSVEKSLSLLHPILLDAGMQTLGIMTEHKSGICIPYHIETIELSYMKKQFDTLYVHTVLHKADSDSFFGDFIILDSEQNIYAKVIGITARSINTNNVIEPTLSSTSTSSSHMIKHIYQTTWNRIHTESGLNAGINDFTLFVDEKNNFLSEKFDFNLREINTQSIEKNLIENNKSNIVFVLSDNVESVSLGLDIIKLISIKPKLVPRELVFAVPNNFTNARGIIGIIKTSRLENFSLKITSLECDDRDIEKTLIQIPPDLYGKDLKFDGEKGLQKEDIIDISLKGDYCVLDKNKSYIITGGFGALGMVAADFLVNAGAEHIILLSRNIPEHLPQEILKLKALAKIHCIKCDVSKLEDILNLKRQINSDSIPKVAGIIHTAGVITDAVIYNQSLERLKTAYASKVVGAENLHNNFRLLDFFILYSSAAATFGSPGQASYAAANSALDALAQLWANAGENTLSIQWGAWSDGGMAVKHNAVDRAIDAGFGAISNNFGIEILHSLLAKRVRGTICVSPIDWEKIKLNSSLISCYKASRPFCLTGSHINMETSGVQSISSKFIVTSEKKLDSVMETDNFPAPKSEIRIVTIVTKAIEESIGKKLNHQDPLMQHGLNSLSAVALAQSLSELFSLELSSTFAINFPTIEAIVEEIGKRLNEKGTFEQFASQSFLDVPSNGVYGLANVFSKIQNDSADQSPLPNGAFISINEENSNHANLSTSEPIAIISTACRFPGGINSTNDLWQALMEERDCISTIPSNRFDISKYLDTDVSGVGKIYTDRGGFLDDIESFDYDFFNISESEAIAMDPQQKVILEVAYEAFSNAGYDKKSIKNKEIGVFIGQMSYDWAYMGSDTTLQDPYYASGSSPSITANRISYILGLTGPSITIDTACSSSLVAIDLAVEKLRSNYCRMAIAGGVNLILNHRAYLGCCAAKMLSVNGRCATFDISADGYCRGEGAGVIVLKKLSDAKRDDDRILALIKGTFVNQDGKSASITAPNMHSQIRVISRALESADLEGKDIDYVECHGTGTPLGDPIEIESIKKVFSSKRSKELILGSIKTNIGHTEGAAGIAGIIKAVEVLRHGVVPGNIHFETLNPKIDITDFRVNIPKNATVISTDLKNTLYAGVSSFGFGGTNAHVVLQSYERLNYKIPKLKKDKKQVWIFSGQGTIHPGCAKDLYEKDEIFRKSLNRYTEILETYIDIPILDLLILDSPLAKSILKKTEYQQPALTALQLAMVDAQLSNYLYPLAVVGHSIGEIAAASIAGCFGADDALRLSAMRGKFMSECTPGAMLTVMSSYKELGGNLPPSISIAVLNNDSMTVLSGTKEELENFATAHLKQRVHTFLPVSHAFHSIYMQQAAQRFEAYLKDIKIIPPSTTRFISTVTASEESVTIATPVYWSNQIISPVNFIGAAKFLKKTFSDCEFIEIGPSTSFLKIFNQVNF